MQFELVGGPAFGIHTIGERDDNGQLFSKTVYEVVITHGNCACAWCNEIEGSYIDHYYIKRTPLDQVYIYDRSEKSKPQPPLREGVFQSTTREDHGSSAE